MNKRKGGLGKGLGALLEECKDTNSCGVRDINVDKIKKSPYQPRTSIDEASLNELVQSIKENGLIEPLVVRFVDGFYELIAGHRRLMALKALNLETAPVYILDIDDMSFCKTAGNDIFGWYPNTCQNEETKLVQADLSVCSHRNTHIHGIPAPLGQSLCTRF